MFRIALWLPVATLVSAIFVGMVVVLLAWPAFQRPMFRFNGGTETGFDWIPTWRRIRPIQDHSRNIAFVDPERNVIILFVATPETTRRPTLVFSNPSEARFQFANDECLTVTCDRNSIHVIREVEHVATAQLPAETARRVYDELDGYDARGGDSLLDELKAMLGDDVAAVLPSDGS
jgi:hypothetical protein